MQTATPTILQKIGYSYKDEEENEFDPDCVLK